MKLKLHTLHNLCRKLHKLCTQFHQFHQLEKKIQIKNRRYKINWKYFHILIFVFCNHCFM